VKIKLRSTTADPFNLAVKITVSNLTEDKEWGTFNPQKYLVLLKHVIRSSNRRGDTFELAVKMIARDLTKLNTRIKVPLNPEMLLFS